MTKEQEAEIERVKAIWRRNDAAEWKALSDAEQEDFEARAKIRAPRGEPDADVLTRFRANATATQNIPLPAIGRGWDALTGHQELLAATWSEFADKSLADLRIIRDTLREVEQRHDQSVADGFQSIETYDVVADCEDEDDREAFIYFFEMQLPRPEMDAFTAPPRQWIKMHPAQRRHFIDKRREIQRHEDAARAARFRLTVCEIVMEKKAMFGAVERKVPDDVQIRDEASDKRGYGLSPDVQRWIKEQMDEEVRTRTVEEADKIVVRRLREVHGIERKPGVARSYYYK